MVGARTSCDDAADAFDEGGVLHVLARDVEWDVLRVDDTLHEAQPVRQDVVSSDPISTVSWPWVPARGSLEPSRRGGENAQKTGKNGEKMGEIRSKTCEQGRERRNQLERGDRPLLYSLRSFCSDVGHERLRAAEGICDPLHRVVAYHGGRVAAALQAQPLGVRSVEGHHTLRQPLDVAHREARILVRPPTIYQPACDASVRSHGHGVERLAEHPHIVPRLLRQGDRQRLVVDKPLVDCRRWLR